MCTERNFWNEVVEKVEFSSQAGAWEGGEKLKV